MAPASIVSRLRSYMTGKQQPKLPAISTASAVALLILYTFIYVVPFYVSSATRPSPQLSRDAPSVIRGRIQSVTISCILCCVTTLVILASYGDESRNAFVKSLHLMGYFPVGLMEAAKGLALTAILFLGPLFEAGVVEGGWRDCIRLRGTATFASGWIGYRNLVAGPITEEILFRSCSVPLLLLSESSNSTIVFLTPIVFGLAHFHHYYEFRITHPETPVLGALLRSLFQFAYTTLFGGYATFLYLRTGSLLTVIVVHSFCNWMGLPRFWGRLESGESLIRPDIGSSKKREDDGKRRSNSRLGIVWTLAYYILLVIGATGWYMSLWTLTRSDAALTIF